MSITSMAFVSVNLHIGFNVNKTSALASEMLSKPISRIWIGRFSESGRDKPVVTMAISVIWLMFQIARDLNEIR